MHHRWIYYIRLLPQTASTNCHTKFNKFLSVNWFKVYLVMSRFYKPTFALFSRTSITITITIEILFLSFVCDSIVKTFYNRKSGLARFNRWINGNNDTGCVRLQMYEWDHFGCRIHKQLFSSRFCKANEKGMNELTKRINIRVVRTSWLLINCWSIRSDTQLTLQIIIVIKRHEVEFWLNRLFISIFHKVCYNNLESIFSTRKDVKKSSKSWIILFLFVHSIFQKFSVFKYKKCVKIRKKSELINANRMRLIQMFLVILTCSLMSTGNFTKNNKIKSIRFDETLIFRPNCFTLIVFIMHVI